MTRPKRIVVEWHEDGLEVAEEDQKPPKDQMDLRGKQIINYRSAWHDIKGTYRFLSEHAGADLYIQAETETELPIAVLIPRLLSGTSISITNCDPKASVKFSPDGPMVMGGRELRPGKTCSVTWGPRDLVKIVGEVV